jgi:hypothetical protein
MKYDAMTWWLILRRRCVFGPVELTMLALIGGVILASVADYALAIRHAHRLESAVYAGLAEAKNENNASNPNLDTIKQAALKYLGMESAALPKGTLVSAMETCSCQNGIIETMEGMCPAKCEGDQTVERKYVRVTFVQSHDWMFADKLLGGPQSLMVSRAIRVR